MINFLLQPDVAFHLFPPTMSCPVKKESISLMHSRLHDEINSFCKHVRALIVANLLEFLNWNLCIQLLSLNNAIHGDICQMMAYKVAAENMAKKPYITWAVKRVTRSLQVLWPRSRTNIFGSNATGLSLPSSDVDLVVCLPPVRNLVSSVLQLDSSCLCPVFLIS